MTTEEKYRDEAVDKLSLFTRLQDRLIALSMEGKLENDNKYLKEYTAIREEIIKALVAKRVGEEEVISKYCKGVEALRAKIKELEAEMLRQGKPIEIIQQVKMDDFDEVGEWQIGDIIRFTLLTGEEVEAQCQRVDPEGATFCLTHCLEEEQPMNKEDTNKGGWDESDLRKYLNTEILNSFPELIRSKMKPVYKDDLLTLPAVEDIFGEWDYDRWEPKEGAEPNWPLMKHRQYRAKGNWWWERSAYYNNATNFCYVTANGSAYNRYASRSYGLAPAFLITKT